MASSLASLSNELLDNIACHLSVKDNGALRLSGKALCSRLAPAVYLAQFRRKVIYLSTPHLQRLVEVTGDGGMACTLEHCTLIGISRPFPGDDSEDAAANVELNAEADQHKTLLAQAFSNLRQHGQSLATLTLQVDAGEYRAPRYCTRREGAAARFVRAKSCKSWQSIWNTARRTFSIAMSALSKSNISVTDTLDLYSELRGCSLVCDDFLNIQHVYPSLAGLQSLKRLKARLSSTPRVAVAPASSGQEGSSPSDDGSEFAASQRCCTFRNCMHIISAIMPAIKSLDLSWFIFDDPDYSDEDPSLVSPGPSPGPQGLFPVNLSDCELSGFYFCTDDLLRFLKTANPEFLSLTHITMVDVTWGKIFQHIASDDSGIKSYLLDDLFQGQRLIHLKGPGKTKFPIRFEPDAWPSTLSRCGSQSRETIEFTDFVGFPKGSGASYRWRANNRAVYGPPQHYDFVVMNWVRPLFKKYAPGNL